MFRRKIQWLGAGEREIKKILRLGPDPGGGGMLLVALTDGVKVEGKLLPEGHAMVAVPGEKVVLPGEAYFFV